MFRSGRSLATATVVLLAVQAALLIFCGLGLALLFEPWIAWRHDLAHVIVFADGLDLLVFLATAVVFSMWIHRATKNLPAIGSSSMRYSPSSAVWQFYIPFVNLVASRQVMLHIWNESQPQPGHELAFARPRSSLLVDAWWLAWIGGNLAALLLRLSLSAHADRVWATASFEIEHAAAAILAAVLVRRADARQQAMWDDIQRRNSLPQPTGLELR